MTTTHPTLPFTSLDDMLSALDGIVRIDPGGGPAQAGVEIVDVAGFRDGLIDRLIATAVFAEGPERDAARWLIRVAAPKLGAWPASIHPLYMAAGRGEYGNRTAPAIKEGHQGPVFIQGDHYQISAKNWASDSDRELDALRELTSEAIAAGYLNIDIDASTIVDVSLPTLAEQQQLNAHLTAMFTEFIREQEPAGVIVSVGGEIGEVGQRNSTVQELHAFMTAYMTELQDRERMLRRDLAGISKISVQTGTSHGGVVLPDGTIADVAVDFETLGQLSEVARIDYGLGGAVQHGASTLPEVAFGRFADANAIEVHLATAFQNQIFEHPVFPADLKDEIYAYLSANHADERKEGQTDAQFFYGARKRSFGPFKRQLWDLPVETRDRIADDLEASFSLLMQRLGVAGSAELVERFVSRVDVPAPMPATLSATLAGEVVMAGARAEATLEEVEGE